ncbi:MAG: Hpt domain-containing protein [Lachnospiraceae bacterium]|nr:Hpt domain-containing protein [Lachnospiraceae bacterium]
MLDKLREYGCEVDEALERFVDDEQFYRECYKVFFSGDSLKQLGAALDKGDIEAAFICSHTMKGTVGNLGLTTLYDQLVLIVEPLREGKMDGVMLAYEMLCTEWEKFSILA